MITAIVLIEADRDQYSKLGGILADVEGVAEAYSVTGGWDFVALVRVRAPRAAGRCDLRADRQPAGRHAARRRWSPSRSTPSTISKRCSRSASSGRA